jgi:immunity protein 53 of polymorphic toxin system
MASTLERLAHWYKSNCDGDWEHSFGLAIDTLDNPGWSITVDLDATRSMNKPFEVVERGYEHSTDWVRCWKDGTKFRAACGPEKLEEALIVFLDWVEGAE